MKILLLGKNGQVGWELQRTLLPLGEVIALGRQELDFTDFKAIQSTVRDLKPNLIVNAAAYTAVDKAEEEPEVAMAINGIAPGIFAEEAKKINAAIIHYSTDYVFDGTKNEPYTEEDEPNPINVYGRTKLAGEKAIQAVGVPHFIFRTSWVYGLRGRNFLLTILKLAQEQEELRIVSDQIGTPNWCRMIAEATSQILAQGLNDIVQFIYLNSNIYNLSSTGSASWYDLAKKILATVLADNEIICKQVKPILTNELYLKAERPAYSVLDNKLVSYKFGLSLPEWEKLLEVAVSV